MTLGWPKATEAAQLGTSINTQLATTSFFIMMQTSTD
jgi:hypothetical protein